MITFSNNYLVLSWTASTVSAEPAYDYVFRGPPGDTSAPSSSLKLTSSPVRLRSKGELEKPTHKV